VKTRQQADAHMKIDAHQHYWQPLRGDYHWMPEDNDILNRHYRPDDLATHLAHHKIEGTVLVQAAASIEETEYMLGMADACNSIRAVVGWIDFENPEHQHQLERLARHPKFVGVRPMIQDIPDINWMLRDDVQWAYRAIVDLDLTFDALGFPQHLDNFLTLMKRHPDMRVVYDHCMKPCIRDAMNGKDAFTYWSRGMTRLAEGTSGSCKFSGLVTEAKAGWTAKDLAPFAHHILDVFGPRRVMWGSDWPVCKLQAEYDNWHDIAVSFTQHLSAKDRAEIFGGTAIRFYRLE